MRALAATGLAEAQQAPIAAEQRLAGMIDLSDSIRVSAAQLADPGLDFEAIPVDLSAVRADFLDVRAALLRSVQQSFHPGSGYVRTRLPQPDYSAEPAKGVEPYQRFYRAQQREMDFRISGLLERVRAAASDCSPELRQLVRLDKTLQKVMTGHARLAYNSLAEHLGRHLQELIADSSPEQAYPRLFRNMKAMLLAEIETRLLPILGLVEAIEQHHQTEHND